MINKSWIAEVVKEYHDHYDEGPPDLAELIRKHCPFKEGTAYVELKPIPRGTIVDWATKAAQYIRSTKDDVGRTAAVITTFAEPLLKALDASRRQHSDTCEAFYDLKCGCGADEHNKRIDDALQGYPPLMKVQGTFIEIDGLLLDQEIKPFSLDDLGLKSKGEVKFDLDFRDPEHIANEKMFSNIPIGEVMRVDAEIGPNRVLRLSLRVEGREVVEK